MPVYEYLCTKCGRREDMFVRSMATEVEPPVCRCDAGAKKGTIMQRAISKFAQHRTLKDQVAEAEARFGKEVDDAMGASPDIGKYANRYEELAKDLPPE